MRLVGRVTALLLAVTRTQLVEANLDRVGDVCWTLDLYVKWTEQAQTRRRTVVIGNPGQRARPYNPCLFDYWRPYVSVVTWEQRLKYAAVFRSRDYRPPLDLSATLCIDGDELGWLEAMLATQETWERGGRPPLLALRENHARRGRALLASLGISADAWFVCLHVREPGWFNEGADSSHRHTDADVLTYIPAIEAITGEGGWVIRMGDRTMKRLPELAGVIDYAHEPGRTDDMDVFLAAECRFFLGSTSGLFGLPSVFGRPVALANFCPPSDRPWTSRDRFIPKLLWSESENRFVSFREAMQPDLRFQGHVEIFEERGLRFIDNDPDDIQALAVEMLRREIDPGYYSAEDMALRERYDSIAREFLRHGITSAVGRDFLRKHKDLLN
jgi:putative glycosyltransferase (TIGR04372 family)